MVQKLEPSLNQHWQLHCQKPPHWLRSQQPGQSSKVPYHHSTLSPSWRRSHRLTRRPAGHRGAHDAMLLAYVTLHAMYCNLVREAVARHMRERPIMQRSKSAAIDEATLGPSRQLIHQYIVEVSSYEDKYERLKQLCLAEPKRGGGCVWGANRLCCVYWTECSSSHD